MMNLLRLLKIGIGLVAILLLKASIPLNAQPYTSIEITKPKNYENRTLGAEKTDERKFGFLRRIVQNTVSHYNYHFNAQTKILEIVENAKKNFREDYTRLLPFYNFKLEETALQSNEIDSILYKCTAGILLHDLRNNWIDNLYLLMGQAYYYRKDFDSAHLVFQYINYSYAAKEDGGYDIPIGSNSSNDKGVFSIATKEHHSLWKKLTTHPESRNDALLWMAKNFLAQQKLGEASSILSMLKSDPNFPKRLNQELNENIAWLYYHLNAYDSAAHYLSKVINHTSSKQEATRRMYLVGQLYALANQPIQAGKWFKKCASESKNQEEEIHALLQIASLPLKENDADAIIRTLLSLTKKDKYFGYQAQIYLAAANVALSNQQPQKAISLLLKALTASSVQPNVQNKVKWQLANTYFNQHNFIKASHYFDSVDVSKLDSIEANFLSGIQNPLQKVAQKLADVLYRDSLLRIALLPEKERDQTIHQIVKEWRKAKGLKEAAENITAATSNNPNADWYFANSNLKSKGYAEFIRIWGNRPNVDHWRRSSVVDKKLPSNTADVLDETITTSTTSENEELTVDLFLQKLPLTESEQILFKKEIIKNSLAAATLLHQYLDQHQAASTILKDVMIKYPDNDSSDAILFQWWFCAKHLQQTQLADSIASILQKNYTNSPYAVRVSDPTAPSAEEEKNKAATQQYRRIYELFVSGRFEEALHAKSKADAQFGTTFWTPQLLYIEAVYFVTQQKDSSAFNRLNTLVAKFPDHPITEKAQTMIDVLRRKSDIIDYLNTQTFVRKEDTPLEVAKIGDQQIITTQKSPVIQNQSSIQNIDTSKTILQPSITAPSPTKQYNFNTENPHYVAIFLHDVNAVFTREAVNAFSRYHKSKFELELVKVQLDEYDGNGLILIGSFVNAAGAVDYLQKNKSSIPTSVLPWLERNKYTISMISTENLKLLKEFKDLDQYNRQILSLLPGIF